MGNNFFMREDTWVADPDVSGDEIIQGAIAIARRSTGLFTFQFKGVSVTVAADSNPEHVLRDWVAARIQQAPPMEFSEDAGKISWGQFRMLYKQKGMGGIMDQVQSWARLMQLEMAEGKALADIWDQTSNQVLAGMDELGRLQCMHILTVCWVHGSELDRLLGAK